MADDLTTVAGAVHWRVYSTSLKSLAGAGWQQFADQGAAVAAYDEAIADPKIKRAALVLVTESVVSTHSKA